jgi:hypothetical protein
MLHQTIHVKTVDADTGKPLAGVTTEWREDRYEMFLRGIDGTPTNLPATGQDGMIAIHHLHRNWVSTFIFSSPDPDYPDFFGKYAGGAFYIANSVSLYTNGMRETDFNFEGSQEAAIKNERILSRYNAEMIFDPPRQYSCYIRLGWRRDPTP